MISNANKTIILFYSGKMRKDMKAKRERKKWRMNLHSWIKQQDTQENSSFEFSRLIKLNFVSAFILFPFFCLAPVNNSFPTTKVRILFNSRCLNAIILPVTLATRRNSCFLLLFYFWFIVLFVVRFHAFSFLTFSYFNCVSANRLF